MPKKICPISIDNVPVPIIPIKVNNFADALSYIKSELPALYISKYFIS